MKHRHFKNHIFACLLCIGGAACHETAKDAADPTDSETDEPEAIVPVDVCRFVDKVTVGPPDAAGLVDIPPNYPGILYFGRVDCATPTAPAFAYPGVSIRARFEGDTIEMCFRDNGTAELINYYNIIIDDGEPTVLAVSAAEEVYPLATGLADGAHTVEIFKRVESGPLSTPNAGKGVFLGFRIRDGKRILPLDARPHRMEFIGDSITCGYGNEASSMDPTRDNLTYTTEHSNAYKAFSAITARTLDAEYMAVAFSGRGVTRNYDNYEGDTLPEMYLKTLPEDLASATWDVSRFTPEVVVINLGTNDFSIGVDDVALMREGFRYEYGKFIETLRGYYPDAVFILAVGPMLSDSYPEGYDAWTNIQADVSAVVEARRQAGDADFHFLAHTPHEAPYGEDWHPTAATHEKMAEELLAFIDTLSVFWRDTELPL